MLSRRTLCASFVAALAPRSSAAEIAPPCPQLGRITVGGKELSLDRLPSHLLHDASPGLVIARPGAAQRIHARPEPESWCGESRCTIAPQGDYLLMFTAGKATTAASPSRSTT